MALIDRRTGAPRTRRGVLALAVSAALSRFVTPAAASAGTVGGWSQGDARSSIAGDDGTITINAENDLNIVARHVRMGTFDGNYEFEHSRVTTETHLNSYYVGTPTRTSVSVGGNDGQDVLSFIVRGKLGQRRDLQQWIPGAHATLAVDGHGRLRMGQVTLTTEIVNDTVRLIAILPNGSRRVLAQA